MTARRYNIRGKSEELEEFQEIMAAPDTRSCFSKDLMLEM